MNKKQLIVIWVISILISIIFYGSAYSDTKVSHPVKFSHTPNLLDNMLYKKVVLPGMDKRSVLVNHLTGEVKYILVNDKKWIPLSGMSKKQYQARYDVYVASKK